MNIQEKISNEKFREKYDYRDFYSIESDNINLSFLDGEPEDANLSRDFSNIYKIKFLVQEAYEAGKNGEELNFRSIKISSFNEI